MEKAALAKKVRDDTIDMAATEAASEIKKSEDISSLGVGKVTPI